jgi:hypothetical protein
MTWASGDVARRALSTIALTNDRTVADLTLRRARAAGADDSALQALADQLQDRTDGIRYRLRHDLGARLVGIALFGKAGPAAGKTLASLPRPTTTDIPDELLDRASRQFGYRVLPLP